jgi:hypothetical protein
MATKDEMLSAQAMRVIRRILADDCPKETKYAQLDALQLSVMSEHTEGNAAKIVQTIAAAQTQVLYPGWKG